ncbi:hypothetical protein [Pseudomonas sp. NFACC05-1]|uniref:hypothetical protein n=1 Tax=Pseudomonas sp. NFACC05-1 TaxID=1566241 RepID=UPI000871359A|nr:hypothetical protein [Pseudomonas sp. NFACC05-1]SCW81380.1 hypothetical protein SAMN03159424_03366 [Pseudomonas sp. NFACC05-1]
MTVAKESEIESAAISLMDAKLQLLLAITWQHGEGDGLTRLDDLANSVKEKVAGCSEIFESDRDQEIAGLQILDALQEARRLPEAERVGHLLDGWAILPTNTDLAQLHRETAAPYQIARTLVAEAKRDFEARVDHRAIAATLRRCISALGKQEQFPFYVPALAACFMELARRPGHVTDEEITLEVARYEKEAERIAADKQRIKRNEIVAELLPAAERICLQIDQSYSWGDLAINARGITSLSTLGIYTQLNYYGLVTDAHFSPKYVKTPIIPADTFHKEMTIWFLRVSTLMYSGDDRETRILRRSIVDSERADVRVYGKRVLDSLVLLVPLDDEENDIEKQLALLLIKLDSSWRRRNVDLVKSARFLEKLPVSLRDLVVSHGMRRKVIRTKKTLLFCLAGLIAENVYRYRHKHVKLLEANGRRTRADIDEYVADLLKEHGFQYSAETLRRKRSQWRREFLERVPEIFGLGDA